MRLQATAGNGVIPTAVVVLRDPHGHERTEAACGDGPLDAAFQAVVRLTHADATLRDLEVRSVTRGGDAQAEAVAEVEHNGRRHRGRGLSTDIVEASVRAALAAINRILAGRTADVARASEGDMTRIRSSEFGIVSPSPSQSPTPLAEAGGAR